MLFQEFVTDFRIPLYVTIETKFFNYFMKLLKKTGWLNDKPQNIRVGLIYFKTICLLWGEGEAT